jgi:hypothetical protein
MCAIHCAASGAAVTILEKNASAGKKLLITGSGRCNLTHAGGIREFTGHYGGNDRFVKPALFNFTNDDLQRFFEARNLKIVDAGDGKLFPATGRSSDVLKVLLDECARLAVTIAYNSPVTAISRTADGFAVSCAEKDYRCDFAVIAAGGASYPQTGSTGDGYPLAKKLGHAVVETAPALAPIIIKDFSWRSCAGISLHDTTIFLYRAAKKMREQRGDVLFTHVGLSGPGILDMSRFVRAGDVVKIAFVNYRDRGTFEDELVKDFAGNGKQSLLKRLSRYAVPERLVLRALALRGIAPEANAASIDRKTRALLADALTGFPFVVQQTGDFTDAMVTRGGVALHEINPKTMESRIVKGLFFAGEAVDVDGDTGGYNLQFAFSSGALAAKGMGENNEQTV